MDSNVLSHGGPGSGRYPKGSGDRPYQRTSKEFTRKRSIFKKKQRKSKEDNPTNKDAKLSTVAKATKKPISQMTDAELDFYTNRLTKEENFKKALDKAYKPTTKEKIGIAVRDALGKAGKQALEDVTKAASTYAAKKIIEKAGWKVEEPDKDKKDKNNDIHIKFDFPEGFGKSSESNGNSQTEKKKPPKGPIDVDFEDVSDSTALSDPRRKRR